MGSSAGRHLAAAALPQVHLAVPGAICDAMDAERHLHGLPVSLGLVQWLRGCASAFHSLISISQQQPRHVKVRCRGLPLAVHGYLCFGSCLALLVNGAKDRLLWGGHISYLPCGHAHVQAGGMCMLLHRGASAP